PRHEVAAGGDARGRGRLRQAAGGAPAPVVDGALAAERREGRVRVAHGSRTCGAVQSLERVVGLVAVLHRPILYLTPGPRGQQAHARQIIAWWGPTSGISNRSEATVQPIRR